MDNLSIWLNTSPTVSKLVILNKYKPTIIIKVEHNPPQSLEENKAILFALQIKYEEQCKCSLDWKQVKLSR